MDGMTPNSRQAKGAPAVSVIIPAYNVAPFIGEALESVFAQTFTDYEVIVVNDGSPDTGELERVLEPYRGRLVYIRQENRGLSGARNTGIRAARAPLVALLDADDVWEPEYLAVQVRMLERDPTVDVLYPNALIFGDGLDAGREFMDLNPSEGEVTFESLLTHRCNVMVSVTARREAIVRAGMFDEGLRSVEDFDLWLRVVKQGRRIAYHRRRLVRYRRRAGSLSSDPVWMCEHGLKVLEKAEAAMSLTPAERQTLRQAITRFRANLCFHRGKRAFFQGDVREAIENLKRANGYMKSLKLSLSILGLRLAPQLLLRAYNMRDRFLLGADTKY
jgi:glycosyltransferase involved in cell wall biosynthesis